MQLSFDPLGNFNRNAAVNPGILAKAKAFMVSLRSASAHGLQRCYLHWTVAPMGCDFPDYNAEEKIANGVWTLKMEHNPQDDVDGLNSNAPIAGTWHRNAGSIAIAITGMDGATESDFGPDGVTLVALEHLCAGAAALCAKYGIDANGTVAAPGSESQRQQRRKRKHNQRT